jgi:hypothetical protein
MKGYTQLYIDKINKEGKKIKNKHFDNSKSISLKESNNNELKNNNSSNILTERNSSVLTFSNFRTLNSQDSAIKNSEKIISNNSPINNKLNNNKNTDYIIEQNKNRIRYRKKNFNHDNSFNICHNKIIVNYQTEKTKEENNKIPYKNKIIDQNINNNLIESQKNKERLNISIKEKLKEQIKKAEESNNNTNKLSETIKSEGNNNFTYEIKEVNKINHVNEDINNTSKTIKSKEKEKIIKENKIQNLYEDSIKKEKNNSILISEDKFINNDNEKNNDDEDNYHFTISKNEETLKSINITKESLDNKFLTKEQVLYFTHIIFLNNATFIRKKECYMMSKNNFLNILKPLNIIKSQLILVEIDLIFDSISEKSSMIVYSQFNQILMKIIQKIYPEEYELSPKMAINYFINKLISHYHLFFENKIPKDYLYKYQYNSIVKLIQIMPNKEQIILINHVILTINEIYEKYFIYELEYNGEYLSRSSENLVKFCRDFEIIPSIINPTQSVTYYNLIINIKQIYDTFENELHKMKITKNKGIKFTLFHFIFFLIHMSLYSYTKVFESKSWNFENNNISNEAKLLLFLERLEHSKGMTNFLSKLYTPRTKALSLIPPRDICLAFGRLDMNKKKQKVNESLDDIFFKEKDINIDNKKLLENA